MSLLPCPALRCAVLRLPVLLHPVLCLVLLCCVCFRRLPKLNSISITVQDTLHAGRLSTMLYLMRTQLPNLGSLSIDVMTENFNKQTTDSLWEQLGKITQLTHLQLQFGEDVSHRGNLHWLGHCLVNYSRRREWCTVSACFRACTVVALCCQQRQECTCHSCKQLSRCAKPQICSRLPCRALHPYAMLRSAPYLPFVLCTGRFEALPGFV